MENPSDEAPEVASVSEPFADAARATNFSPFTRGVLVLIALATVLVVELGLTGGAVLLLALAFFCAVPGAAIINLGPKMDKGTIAALTLATSLAISALVALVAVVTELYAPKPMLDGTAAVAVLLLLFGHRLRRSKRAEDEGEADFETEEVDGNDELEPIEADEIADIEEPETAAGRPTGKRLGGHFKSKGEKKDP